MKIQIISYVNSSRIEDDMVICSNMSNPKSLDEFDLNIIDLTTSVLWRNKNSDTKSINAINDFKSIQIMVDKCNNAKVLYMLPKNETFESYYYRNGYAHSVLLKDMLDSLCNYILPCILPSNIPKVNLIFENTRTSVGGNIFSADFYFDGNYSALTQSSGSNKVTTVQLKDRVFATTLNILKGEFKDYINHLFDKEEKEPVPDWALNYLFNDDVEQADIISENQQKIEEAQREIGDAENKLKENLKYKSILYTNGDELVTVVFEILEKILDCNLDSFVDKKDEDFIIQKETITFIGEIKGIGSNVKSDNIAQIERHYQRYMDDLDEQGKEENVKQLLIINPLRTKRLEDREPIHQRQIELATRNGCLIIETVTLLKMFEKALKNEITTEGCIDIFSSKVGVLQLSDF